MGVSEPCFLNNLLDDYASTPSQDTEIGADIRSIGLLTSMGNFFDLVYTYIIAYELRPSTSRF